MKRHQEATMQSQSLTVRELAIPFAIYLVICTLTLSRVPSITTDSINYINSIDSACCWFHPHHLLYGPLAWAWVAIWRSLGIRIDSELLVSELNTIFGALSLCAFYSIVRCRLGSDRWTAVLVTGLPAFSWGLWYYSGCVEVYVIPLFCLLLSLFLLSAEHVDGRTFAFAGFLNGVAVAFAELSVLFAVVVLLAAWYSHQRGDVRLTKSLTIYVSAALPTVALPYLWALSSLHKVTSFETALRWLTDYGHYSRFWSPLSASSIFKAGVGLGQAFIGSHFVFALPLFRSWVEIKLRDFYLINDIYLVRNLGADAARFLVALSIALCLIVLFSGGFSIFSWPELSLQKQRLIYLSLVWVLAYGVFILFYTPINAKYWIAPSVCLWIMFIALWLDAAKHKMPFRWSRVVLAIVVALMFVVNFAGSIRFTRNRDNDYYYSQVQPLLELSNADDLIVLGGSEKLQAYLRRYGKVRSVLLTSVCETGNASSECVLRVESAIEEELAAGGTVLISRDALVPGQETIRRYPGIIAFRSLWNRYGQRWITREFQENTVYILEPRNSGGLNPHLETYRVTVGR